MFDWARKKRKNCNVRREATRQSRFSLEVLESRLLLSGDPLAVTQFQSTPTGFTAHFNSAIDTSVLNLYDTETGALGPADVTVTGNAEKAVSGSLVVQNDTITFVRSGGLLASDTYTVTLRSAANGFKDSSGGLLDGNGDGTTGDDYANTFTVGPSSAVALIIGDFARGPAQVVEPGVGLPITISEGTDVTDVRFTLQYDASILTVHQVEPGAGLPAGTQLETDLSHAGFVSVHVHAPSSLSAGSVELVRLQAEVPASALYGKAAVLHLGGLSINNGAIASVGDDGIQVAAYFGDATGNQGYSALDATRVLRVVTGLDSGFVAYPTIYPNIIADITGNNSLSSLDATRVLQEVVGLDRPEIPAIVPVIRAGLANDTGASAADTITNDPDISGTVSDDGTIEVFKAGLDGTNPQNFLDVTSDLTGRTFSFNRARLEQILGGPLADGTHTLHLQATDNQGNTPSIVDLGFTLDTSIPVITTFGLALGSDTGTVGDNITAAEVVVMTGSVEPGALLTLGATQVLSTGAGTFQIPNAKLNAGPNSFTVSSIDIAGNSSQANLNVTQQGAVTTDVALQWNQQTLDAIRLTVMDVPPATRVLAMVSLAQYDTLAAIEGAPAYLVHETVSGSVSLEVALARAAHTVLYALFPSLRSNFDSTLNALLASVPDGMAKTNALSLGLTVGNAVLAIRASDGSDAFVDYSGSEVVGQWRPTPPMYNTADEPQWGSVTPFAIESGDAFLLTPPPALHSAEYAASVNEVESLGSAVSTTRTTDQTQIAQFWADGQGSYTPPGHWNQIAQQIALANGNSLSANVRLLAELNVALADSAITVWDDKYTYGLWRPVDAIRNADQDNNPATIADNSWTPLLITPSFPEYTSGHSTFSSAAATVLAATFGDNTSFTTTAYTLQGVTRSFSSFTQAAQEAGRSRIYGGIHYEFTNDAGQQLGKNVAAAVLARFVLSQDVQPPVVIAVDTPAVTNSNLTMHGQILDNISGVDLSQYRIDNGPLQTLVLDNEGNFSITTAFALNGTSDGLHTIFIVTKDAANNTAPAFFRSFTLDTAPPIITLDSIADGATIDVNSRLTGSADATGSTITALNYKFDGGAPRSIVFDSSTGNFEDALLIGNLAEGTHTLSIAATDAAGNLAVLTRNVTLAHAIPLTISTYTPFDGSVDVGVTFRPQFVFSRSIDKTTLTASSFYATGPDGQKIAATIVPTLDGTSAWLFFAGSLTGESTITVHVDGNLIHAIDGQLLDADGDGTAGGVFTSTFVTVSTASIPGTKLIGKVVDPGTDLKAMTFDDIRRGPDGIIHTSDDVFLNPIAHAKVYILGRESDFVFTDSNGNFELDNVPVGDVKIAVDGRTATNAPTGLFFPEMVMDAELLPGVTNTVMGSMGSNDERLANADRLEVYLPRIQSTVLQSVSNTTPTVVTVDSNSAPNLTDSQRSQLSLTVAPGSAIGDNGQVLTNVQVGISTVPPELVRDMLPPGVLQHTFDITIQAPGVATFNQPLAITFPNVFNAAPGTKLNILSFDHTTGMLVINGTATVSADGKSVVSDEGSGIKAPGWHGVTPPGTNGQGTVGGIPAGCGAAGAAIGAAAASGTEAGINAVGTATSAIGILQNIEGLGTGAFSFFTGVALGADIVSFGAEPTFANFSKLVLSGVALTGGPWGLAAGTIRTAWGAYDIYHQVNGMIDSARQAAQARIDCLDAQIGMQGMQPMFSPSDASDPELEALAALLQQAADEFAFQRIHYLNIADAITAITPLLKIFDPGNTSMGGLSAAQVQMFIDKLTGMIDDGKALASRPRLLDVLSGAVQAYGNYISEVVDDVFVRPLPGGVAVGLAAPMGHRLYAAIEAPGGFVDRFGFDSSTGFQQFLKPQTIFKVSVFDPTSLYAGTILFKSATAGFSSKIPMVGLASDSSADDDGDGLTNLAEFTLGTRADARDSDGDGISDMAEILSGTNPLDARPTATGILASVPLVGTARAVAPYQSADLSNTVVAVATGPGGISLVDASMPGKLTVLSQLDLPGVSVDVSVDPVLNIAAVASPDSGLYLINVADPLNPQLVRTINALATQVEVVDGIAYAAVGLELRAYDLQSGDRVQTLTISSNVIIALARDGQILYAADSGGVLRVVDLRSGLMLARGSVTVPVNPSKLFVGGGIAYVAAGNGFATVNVTNPDILSLLSGPDATNLAVGSIAANGSGLAVSVGSPFLLGNLVEILDVSDPTNTNGFLTQYTLPAAPFDVAIGGGLAFIADGTAGLVVVNYRAFDSQGVAPAVSAQAQVTDLDLLTPGIQVQEGTTVRVNSTITDDVQVRDAVLLLNGDPVRSDVSFPFDLTVNLPTIAANGSNAVTLQVRATDTGGNVGLSQPIALQLVPDTFAPSIQGINPADGAKRGKNFHEVIIDFSEAMDETTLTAVNIQLIGPGGIAAPTQIQVRNNGRTVQFTYPTLAVGVYQISINRAAVKDRAGNAIGTGTTTSSFTIVQATAVFTNGTGSGFWDQAGNWDTGVVPTATDDVLLDFPGAGTVVFRTGAATIRSLSSVKPFTISGGVLTVTETVQINNTFTMTGGTLKDATILPSLGSQVINATFSGGVLSGVAINGNLTIANGTFLIVQNGLIVNGVLTSAGTSASTGVAFMPGTQTLGGTGEVVLGTASGLNTISLGFQGSSTVTIGSGIKIHGRGQILQGSASTLINNGTISADVAGQGLSIGGNVFTNNGTISAINGATLSVVSTSWSNTATGIASATGSTLSLAGGSWSNAATGVISAVNSTLTLGGAWSTLNTITVNTTTLNLGGTFTTAMVGLINRTGGTVNLTGTMNNTATTLTLNAATGSWNLLGGTITGGTVAVTGGATLTATQQSPAFNSTFDGVTLNGNLTIVNGAFLIIANGMTLNGIVTSTGTSTPTGVAFLPGTQTLGGTGEVVLGTASGQDILSLGFQGPSTVTIGSGIKIHGRGQIVQGSASTLINNGTISADVAGQGLSIGGSVFTNNGTINAINGGTLSVVSTSWSNTATGIASATGSTLSLAGGSWSNAATGVISAVNSTLTLGGAWNTLNTITVNTTTLNLGGTFATAMVGLISRTGGTVNLTGIMNNTGTTLTLNATTGSWNLLGGTITGGTVAVTGGATLTATQQSPAFNSTFDGVTLNGNLTIVNGAFLIIANGMTLNGIVTSTGTSTPTGVAFLAGTQTLGGTGEVVLGTASGQDILSLGFQGPSTVTIGSGIKIHGRGQILQGSASTLINNGTISADVAGQGLLIGGNVFTNNGTISAINGGTLSIVSTSWSNTATGIASAIGSTLSLAGNTWSNAATGVISAVNSTLTLGGAWNTLNTITVNTTTLNLGGTFATAMVGLISRTGGTVNLTGTMNNTGTTLTLNATTGSWNLLGGTITGGTVAVTGGATLTATQQSPAFNSTFDGVTLNGNLTIVNGAFLIIANGMTLNGIVTSAGTSTPTGVAFLAGTQTLGGTGEVVLGTASGQDILSLGFQGPSTVTIGSGIKIHGRGQILQGSASTLINNGTISADVAGQGLLIGGNVFTNNGTISAINGATLSVVSTSWSNTATGIASAIGSTLSLAGNTWSNAATGVISAVNSTLTLGGAWNTLNTITVNTTTLNLGGTFTTAMVGQINRTGGTVNLTGTMNNTATTLTLNAATGSWNLLGGTITGGTVAVTGGATLTATQQSPAFNSTFDGVTLNGNLTIVNGAFLIIANGMTLNGIVTSAGTSTPTGVAFLAGTQTLGGTGEVVLGTASGQDILSLGFQGPSTVTIGSGIKIHGRGQILQGSASTLINNGTISADVSGQGLLIGGSIFTNNGTINAINGGTLSVVSTSWSNTATGSASATGSTLSLAGGSWSNAATGVISAVNSTLTLGGAWNTLNTITVNTTTLNLGGTFTTAMVGLISRTGGTVNLTGTMNNTGTTLTLNATTGSWNLLGGTITGGTVVVTGGATLTATQQPSPLVNSTFDSVTLNGNLTIVNGAFLIIANGMTLNGIVTSAGTSTPTGVAFLAGTQTLGGTGEVVLGTASGQDILSLGFQGSSTVTIGSGIKIHGRGQILQGSASTLINNGTISADVAGQGLSIGGSVFTNNGTISAINGGTLSIVSTNWSNTATGIVTATSSTLTLNSAFTLTAGTIRLAGGTIAGNQTITLQGGVLSGTGTINGNVNNGALIEVGGSGTTGTLSISGNYTQTAAGILRMEIGGLTPGTQFDQLLVTGIATLGGTLDLLLLNGFNPGIGATFQILNYGSRVGQFATVNGTILIGGKVFTVTYNGTNLTLTVS